MKVILRECLSLAGHPSEDSSPELDTGLVSFLEQLAY
jgi:hypothetical protein